MITRGRSSGDVEHVEVLVPSFRIAKLTRRLQSFERAAKRVGLPFAYRIEDRRDVMEMTFFVLDPETRHTREKKSPVAAVRVILDGVMNPRFAGWTLIARLQPTDDHRQNLVFSSTLQPIKYPERYRTAVGACEHCNLKRRRNETFLLSSERGEFKSVGRECLADFLRTESADLLLEVAGLGEDISTAASDLGSESEYGSARSAFFTTTEVLFVAAWVTSTYGYKSSTAEQGKPTKYIVTDILTAEPRSIEYRAFKQMSDDDRSRAAAMVERARAWLSSQPSDSDYVRNLKLLIAQKFVAREHLGVVASAIVSYQNEIARQSQHLVAKSVGEKYPKGKKVLVPVVELLFVNRVGGYRPGTFDYVHRFVAPDGQAFVWTTSSIDLSSMKGQQMAILGEVKDVRPSRTVKDSIEIDLVRVVINPTSMPVEKKPVKNPKSPEQKQAAADKRLAGVFAKFESAVREAVRKIRADDMVETQYGWEKRTPRSIGSTLEEIDARGVWDGPMGRLIALGLGVNYYGRFLTPAENKAFTVWAQKNREPGKFYFRPGFIRETAGDAW